MPHFVGEIITESQAIAITMIQRDRDAAWAQVERLRRALKRYGRHGADCHFHMAEIGAMMISEVKCTCGFDDV